MKQISTLVAIALLSFLAAVSACSSSPDGSGESDSGTSPLDAGSASDAAASGDAGTHADAGTPADAGARLDAGSASDGGAVVISGTVSTTQTNGQTKPVGSATVEVLGVSPANSTTTASDGTYSLTVAPGAYFVRASETGMMSSQVGVVTSRATTGIDLGLLSTSDETLLALYLQIKLDSSKGIVVVGFGTSDTGGGYSAALTADHGDSFALSGSTPKKSTTTFDGGTNALFFPNVVTGTTGVSFSGPGGHSCTPQVPIEQYRVDPNVVTGIGATCN